MRLVLPLLTLLAPPPQAPAGPPADRPILEAKAEGRYGKALELARAALTALAEAPKLDAERAAYAEYLLSLADNLAVKTAAHAGFAAFLGELERRPGFASRPLLAGRAGWLRVRHLKAAGRCTEAADEANRLGFVRELWALGPLDNERGSGFGRSFAPERAPAKPFDFGAEVAGKKRKVRFRRLVTSEPSAAFALGARMHPNRQVLALLAFGLSAAEKTALALRIGSAGSVAVFVDGVEVHRHEVQRRRLGFDQDAAGFEVEAGAHLVLVKVCAQDGPFQARLRLTALDGSPAPKGVRLETGEAALRALFAGKTKVSGAKKRRAPRGAYDLFEARLKGLAESKPKPGGPEARARGLTAFRYAFLLAMDGPDDDATRRDRRYARLATELVPDFGPAFHLYAYTLIPLGGSEADRDENARLQAYEQAVAAWPRNAESMRALAEMEYRLRSNLHKAETWLQRALAVNPDYVYARLLELRLLGERDLDALRARRLAELERSGADHPDLLDILESEAYDRDDTQRSAELLERRLARRYERAPLLKLSSRLGDLGRSDEARKLAEQAVRDFPEDRAAYEHLAELLAGRGDLAGAQRVWGDWLDLAPEDEKAWLAIAELAAREGARERLVQALEKALALNPNLKEAKRHLEFLKAETKPFYADFELDAERAVAADPGPAPDARAAGDSHYYILKHVLVHAYRDGTTSRYEHLLVKILNEEGANEYDTWQPTFSGSDQTARILEAKVVHADGKVERARLGRAYWVDLPPLKPGDLVELKARVDDRAPSYFGDYFGLFHFFHGDEAVPVNRSVLDLILEPGRSYHFRTKGGVPDPKIERLADGSEHRRYELRGLKRPPIETNAPSLRESGPWLQVSTYGSWDEFASWWWNLIRKQLVVTPEIKAKVAELTRGADTLEEKVRRIYDFVVTDIRYKAWEFGVHGYKPYSVAAIFARRHGDCKDKAILLNAMLSEIGIKAYPVLIHAEDRREQADLTLPLVQHFNHCISWMPAQKGLPARFMDGTAEYHPIDTIPSMDQGAKVVIVEEGKGRLAEIPWVDPLANRNELRYRVRIAPDGSAVIERLHRPHKNFAPPVRQRLGNEVGKRRQKFADELGAVFGKIEIIDFDCSDLLDLGRPVVTRVRFKVSNFLVKDGDAYRVKAAFRPRNLVRLTSAAAREKDFLLGPPRSYDATIVYEAPEGWRFDGALDGASFGAGPLGETKLEVSHDGRRLTVRRLTVLASQRIPTEAWSEFQEFAREVDRQDRTTFRLVPARSRAASGKR